jgi:hypothetical protein
MRPTDSLCHDEAVDHHVREPSIGEISTIALDLAKTVFQVHADGSSGAPVLRETLRQSQIDSGGSSGQSPHDGVFPSQPAIDRSTSV